ncbi:MAG: tRNA dihydrouridine synthase DusB [Candidatus Schekmanbacteria bacterium]|nr:tRNA dihydrouridine synthase DusB [Candidatus Schekmanbacteria bacterium]
MTSDGFRIGPYAFSGHFILAPMASISELPFRRIAREHGAAAAPTELIGARGLLAGSRLSRHSLRRDTAIETPFWVQLFGGDPAQMGEAAQAARDLGAGMIDLNMGCPVRSVIRGGAGSALHRDPHRAGAIVSAMARSSGLPITVKMRAGWDDASVNAVEVARILQDSGAAALCVHPRTRMQGYAGPARWRLIADVKAAATIPVIGNGDVFDRHTAAEMFRTTGCDAIMIGRAARGYPFLFRLLGDATARPPRPLERFQVLRRHFNEYLEGVPSEPEAVRAFRRQLRWYARGLQPVDAQVGALMQTASAAETMEVAERIFVAAEKACIDAVAPPIDWDATGAVG